MTTKPIVISTGEIGTFTETGNALLRLVNYMTQHEDGDIFVSAHLSISRVSYEDKSVKKIVGVKSVRNDGDEVGLFSEALFSYPAGLQFIGKKDRKSTRLNSSHPSRSRMPSSA